MIPYLLKKSRADKKSYITQNPQSEQIHTSEFVVTVVNSQFVRTLMVQQPQTNS